MQGAEDELPLNTEICYWPYKRGGTNPGFFIFTDSARMMRPVTHIATDSPVLVGTLEQHNLSIRSGSI